MADVKWIKIVTDIFDDEKIRYIETLPNGDETIVIWFRILCLAGKSNRNGVLMMTDRIAYTDEMLSSIFARDIKAIQMALSTFNGLGMIEMIDNKIYLTNWEKHQNVDKLEQIRESTRKRVATHRQKLIGVTDDVTLQKRYSNVTVTQNVTPCNATDKELDLDKEIERKNNKNIVGNTFVVPTLDEVKSYCSERKNTVDAEQFIDFYTAKNWYIGKNKMKDWKAVVRTWEKNRNGKSDRQDILPFHAQQENQMSESEANSLKEWAEELTEERKKEIISKMQSLGKE